MRLAPPLPVPLTPHSTPPGFLIRVVTRYNSGRKGRLGVETKREGVIPNPITKEA